MISRYFFLTLCVVVFSCHAVPIIDKNSIVSHFGIPHRFIYNSTDNRNMDRFANMEVLPFLIRNPVPYFFIDLSRQGTHFISMVDYTRGRTTSYWNRFVNLFG